MRLFSLALLLAAPLLALAPAAAPAEGAAVVDDASCDVPVRETALSGPIDLVLPVCAGLRPGAPLTTATGTCTLGWLLKSGSQIYATTAGHCAPPGQIVRLAFGNTVLGTPIYTNSAPGSDFAVIPLPPGFNVAIIPAMCSWGGSTGVWTGDEDAGVVRYFGNGVSPIAQPQRARTGVLTMSDGGLFGFQGFATAGDSGGPVRLSTGEAVGIVTDTVLSHAGPGLPTDPRLAQPLVLGTRLDVAMAQASAATGITFSLMPGAMDNELV